MLEPRRKRALFGGRARTTRSDSQVHRVARSLHVSFVRNARDLPAWLFQESQVLCQVEQLVSSFATECRKVVGNTDTRVLHSPSPSVGSNDKAQNPADIQGWPLYETLEVFAPISGFEVEPRWIAKDPLKAPSWITSTNRPADVPTTISINRDRYSERSVTNRDTKTRSVGIKHPKNPCERSSNLAIASASRVSRRRQVRLPADEIPASGVCANATGAYLSWRNINGVRRDFEPRPPSQNRELLSVAWPGCGVG